jgi:hypothetical protein
VTPVICGEGYTGLIVLGKLGWSPACFLPADGNLHSAWLETSHGFFYSENVFLDRAKSASMFRFILGCIVLIFAAGCATPKFEPVNLGEAGWQTLQTQAIWRPNRTGPEITGDLILATNAAGRVFISFSKTLPLITVQASPQGWVFDAPENRSFSARGKPPSRIVWFQIAPALRSEEVSRSWAVDAAGGNLTISNRVSGETLQVLQMKI